MDGIDFSWKLIIYRQYHHTTNNGIFNNVGWSVVLIGITILWELSCAPMYRLLLSAIIRPFSIDSFIYRSRTVSLFPTIMKVVSNETVYIVTFMFV